MKHGNNHKKNITTVLSTDPEFEFEVKELKHVVFIKPIGDKFQ